MNETISDVERSELEKFRDDERRELERLRKEKTSNEKEEKSNGILMIVGVVFYLILVVVLALWLKDKGVPTKYAWIIGILAPGVLAWLLKCPFL